MSPRGQKPRTALQSLLSDRQCFRATHFRINSLTFNVLTVFKGRALPPRYRDARPKRLGYELFTLPGKLAIHHSQLSVRVSADEARLRAIVEIRRRLLAMLEERRAAH